jgi:hypothetical protein
MAISRSQGRIFSPSVQVIIFSTTKGRRKKIESKAVLPDGLFSNQKSQFGKFFQGLRLENVDIF